jgi:WD40 repeat protein/energy-coupling factor transporter ATP-binding protein EcfA2
MPSLFISHADKDNLIAQRVAARVKAQGFDYFLDDDILPGEKWEERIHNAMRECIAVLFCATPDALQSRYVFAEIVMTRFRGIPLIPLIFAKCDLPSFITGTTQYDDFLSDREEGYRKLFAALELLKLKVASEWRHEESPYPGLLAMEEKYAPVFFGRDEDIQKAIEALRPSAQQKRFLAIIGPSGSGKSSLARAGIIPALKRGAIPGSQNWVYVPPFTPGETPFRNLAEKLRTANPSLGGTREIETHLREDKGLLYALLDARHDDVQVVLLIDQLEEIERRTPRDEAIAFLARIRETLDAPDTPLIVLATLRADFVSACLQFPDLARLLQSGTQLLGVMDRAGLRQAIMGPARVAGLQFDNGLVEEILDDTKGGDALPLMAYVLEELWKRRTDSKMTRAVYREVGGVVGALTQTAQAIYDETPEAERESLRCAFIELADVNEHGDFTRRRVLRSSLPTKVYLSLERFVEARLLTTYSDEHGAQIEVAHEALLRNWKPLHDWLKVEDERLRLRREIELAATDWSVHGRIDAYLWNGERAQNALNSIANETWAQNDLRRTFLQTCRDHDHARLARESEQLANRALKDLEQDPERSILLALAASEEYTWTPHAEFGLNASLIASSQICCFRDKSELISVAFSSDGKQIISGSKNGDILVWDIYSQKISSRFRKHRNKINTIFSSPDGRQIITASDDKTTKIWNAKHGRTTLLIRHKDTVDDASFSNNGTSLVMVSKGIARVRDAKTGKNIQKFVDSQSAIRTAAFSPDGSMIVTTPEEDDEPVVKVWRVADSKEVAQLVGHEMTVYSAAFDRDGKRIITASGDGTVRIWDAQSGKEVLRVGKADDFMGYAAISPDESCLVTGNNELVQLWDTKNGNLLRTFHGHESVVHWVGFSPDGTRIASASGDDTIRIWNLDSVKPEILCWDKHQGRVNHAIFSNDGKYIVSASADKTARLWSAQDGREILSFDHHDGEVSMVCISSDAKRLVTACLNIVRVWDIKNKTLIHILSGHGPINSVSFNPDGTKIVAAFGDRKVRLWNLKNGKEMNIPNDDGELVNTVCFSPRGTYLVMGSANGVVKLYDASSGKKGRHFRSRGGSINAIAFDDKESFIFTASNSGLIGKWNIENGEELGSVQSLPMDHATFSHDCLRLVIVSTDRIVGVIDVASGNELLRLVGQKNDVNTASFSSDGKRIITASDDKTVRVWRYLTRNALFDYAKTRVFRELTEGERREYGLPPKKRDA